MEQCSLNYKRFGETGSVVVILHGLFGMLDNWKSFARKLSANHIVYIVDLRNHGKSCHLEEMSYADMSTDVLHFLVEHGLDQVHLMGHSMGGKVAMHFALSNPKKVEKLVVVDIAPKKYEPSHIPFFDALFAVDLNLGRRSEIEEQLSQKIANKGIVQFLMKNLKREEEGCYSWKFNLLAIWKNYKKIIDQEIIEGQFNEDTIFIKGMNSSYIQESDKERILKHFPKASVFNIEKAGHWVHAEQPGLLLKVLHSFLITD